MIFGASVADLVGRIEHHFEHGHAIGLIEIKLRLVERHEQDGRVVFRHADLEDGDHRIALHARRGAERGRSAARGQQRYLVADSHVQFVGQAAAESNAGLLVETVERAEANAL